MQVSLMHTLADNKRDTAKYVVDALLVSDED